MATTIKTVMIYNLNGSTTDFNIPFEYLARKYITVTLIGTDRKVLTLNQDYRFATKTTISTVKAWGPSDGYSTIEIRRYTSTSERLVDFADGSILRAYDLNIAQVQTLHVAEEARDLTADTIGVNNNGNLDARGRRIVNVGDAIDDYDAINLHQVKTWNDSALNSANKAYGYSQDALAYRNTAYQYQDLANTHKDEAYGYSQDALAYRNAAWQYQDLANTRKNEAEAARTEALSYRNTAWQYQDWAKGYKESAESSAGTAKSEADRAKSEADKLGNMNALGGAISAVGADNTVIFKGNTVGRGYYITNANGAVVYSLSLDGTRLSVGSNSSLIEGKPTFRAPGMNIIGDQLAAESGVVRWYTEGGSRQFNITLSGSTVTFNRAGVDGINLNSVVMYNADTISGNTLQATGALKCGSAWMGTDGNVTSGLYVNGSLKGELNTKATLDGLNTKVDNSHATTTYLVDVGHGAQTANPLNNHQGGFEVPSGHSLVGWFSTVGDGSIRYTNWISRCLMKRVESGGWVQCYNIM